MIQCLFTTLMIGVFIAFYIYIEYIPDVQYIYINKNINDSCVIPNINPYDPAILKYIWTPDPIFCERKDMFAYFDEKGVVHMNDTVIKSHGLTNVRCGYSIIVRNGDYDVDYTPEVTFEEPTYVPGDVVRVRCYENELKYDHIHLNVDYKRIIKQKQLLEETDDQLSVYVFGMDSVSRLNAERKLKRTLAFLREDLDGYVFEGHTKVGENTFPNILPFLTGQEAYVSESNYSTVDEHPFVWNNFSDKGYVTYYGEDSPQMSMFMGFDEPPTDHYSRKFFLALRKERSYQIHDAFLFLEAQRIKLTKSSTMCYGSEPKHKLMMAYFQKLFNVYNGKCKFIMSWLNELTHDHLNFLELADSVLYDHFKWLKDHGKLERTVLILMSDHGSRVNEIRNTVIGRIEDRMPLFSVVLPKHIKDRYPHIHKTMLMNTKRLTTNYDGFAFLRNILDADFELQAPFSESEELPKGISLLQEIPKRRTCFEAAIQEHYCPCYSSTDTSTKDTKIHEIALAIVDRLNTNLQDVREQCAVLTLSGIEDAQLINANFQRAEDKEKFSFKKLFFRPPSTAISRFLVVVRTLPSQGIFEATVAYRNKNDIEFLGDINRINTYGNQSSCIDDTLLRSSCFCV